MLQEKFFNERDSIDIIENDEMENSSMFEKELSTLMEMGFSRSESVKSLKKNHFNLDAALNQLINVNKSFLASKKKEESKD